MENFEFKVGDLIKLRENLEDKKYYGFKPYVKNMNFKGFKQITKLFDEGEVAIIDNNYNDYQYTKEMLAEVKRPIKYETIYKREEPILNDKEKAYLGNLIRPFRDKVRYIVKSTNYPNDYIAILIEYDDPIHLPSFKKDTMYKNMELHKRYTLEDLGL